MWLDLTITLAPDSGLDSAARHLIKLHLKDLIPEQIKEAKSLADAWAAKYRAPYDEMRKRRAEREKLLGPGPRDR
jgi:hypothetical protein